MADRTDEDRKKSWIIFSIDTFLASIRKLNETENRIGRK